MLAYLNQPRAGRAAAGLLQLQSALDQQPRNTFRAIVDGDQITGGFRTQTQNSPQQQTLNPGSLGQPSSAAGSVKPADVTGVWEFKVTATDGQRNESFWVSIAREGESLFGSYIDHEGNQVDIRPTIFRNHLMFSARVTCDAKQVNLIFSNRPFGDRIQGRLVCVQNNDWNWQELSGRRVAGLPPTIATRVQIAAH